MTKEEIVKIIQLASSRDMLRETMLEINKEFTHYDEELHMMVTDGAPEGYLTEKIAEKVYNKLYK